MAPSTGSAKSVSIAVSFSPLYFVFSMYLILKNMRKKISETISRLESVTDLRFVNCLRFMRSYWSRYALLTQHSLNCLASIGEVKFKPQVSLLCGSFQYAKHSEANPIFVPLKK